MNLTDHTAISVEAFPRSFRAWFKSAIISWLVLCVVMSGVVFISAGDQLGLMNWLLLLAMSSLIHLSTYSVIGIPFFAYFWPRDHSFVWRIKFSLPIGALLGLLGMWLGFAILTGRLISIFDPEFAGSGLIGAVYGVVTAIIAWKLQSANKTLHPTEEKAPV